MDTKKIKVMIWGTGKIAIQCVEMLLEEIEIVAFVESGLVDFKTFLGKPVISNNKISEIEHDYLIIANNYYDTIFRTNKLENELLINYKDVLYECKEELFRNQDKWITYANARRNFPYISIKCDNLYFFSKSNDIVISENMIRTEKVWSSEEIDFFISKKNTSKGYFLDIGANIGTTSIYAKNKLPSDVQVIAFEPIADNYLLLKANCTVNNFEDIIVENMGLSNVNEKKTMKICNENMGGCCITELENDNLQNAMFMKLDTYVENVKIDVNKIEYIWIDTEGHEAEVIEGAKNVLKNSNAYVYMEYNPAIYIKNKTYESLVNNLQEIFDCFICYQMFESGDKTIKNICEIDSVKELANYKHCDILFMKNC